MHDDGLVAYDEIYEGAYDDMRQFKTIGGGDDYTRGCITVLGDV
jgi:hypothetical protein